MTMAGLFLEVGNVVLGVGEFALIWLMRSNYILFNLARWTARAPTLTCVLEDTSDLT